MVKKSRGFRSGTRRKFRQKVGYRPTITKFVERFKKNEKVVISQEPSSHKGMPHNRFMGKTGIVIGKRGKSYIVEIKEGNKPKKIISRPEHLKVV